MTEEQPKKYVKPYISNKRYAVIKEQISKCIEGSSVNIEDILEIICKNTNYDPNVKKYTPERGQKEMGYRKKMAQEKGLSLYEYLGQKKAYHERKQKMEKSI